MCKLTIKAEPEVGFQVYVYINRTVSGPPDLSARTPYTWTLPEGKYIIVPFQATYDVEAGLYYYREGIRVDPYIQGRESPYRILEFDRVEIDLRYDTYVTVLLREEKEMLPEPPLEIPPETLPGEEPLPPLAPPSIWESIKQAWQNFINWLRSLLGW